MNSYETANTQNNMINARNSATQAELGRQHQIQQTADNTFNSSVDKFTPANQDAALVQKQASVADAFKGNAPTAAQYGGIGTSSAPRVVQEAGDKSVADVFGRSNNRSVLAGNLAGWDQRAFDNKLNLNQSGRDLDLLSDRAKVSAAVNGLEQKTAYNNAYRPNSGVGDLMKFAGTVGSYGAGKGWFNPSAPAVTAATAPAAGADPFRLGGVRFYG